jgi:uncharacterized protein
VYKSFAVLLVVVSVGGMVGCAPQARVVEVQVTVPPQVRVIEVTTTPSPVPPTPTPAPPTSTPLPTSTPTPPPPSALLEPMNYQPQTYNNCGPCSIAILLGYYDHWITQQDVNERVAPGPSLCQIAGYMSYYQLKGRAYTILSPTNGVRYLLANGIPVIASQRLSLDEPIGHYRVVKGYEDETQEFITDDPLQRMGPDYRISYGTFDDLSYAFVLVYPPDKDLLVRLLMRDIRSFEIYDCR